MLTVLKFGASAGGYASVSQQPEYMQRVSADPCFAERELAAMLVSTWSDLQRLPTIGRLRSQVRHRIREWLVKRRIEPTAVQFWVKPGQRISTWRRQHGLE
jgi:hypothetical protein